MFFDSILNAVQQHDLELARRRVEAEEAANKALAEQRRQAGIMNMSDYQKWAEGSYEREVERQKPQPKEAADVDVPRPNSSARFPPPPRRA